MRFCVKCGKDTDEIIQGLCKEHFLEEKNPLELPAKVDVDFDSRSSRIRVSGKWVPFNEENARLAVEKELMHVIKKTGVDFRSIEFNTLEETENGFLFLATVHFSVEGVSLEFSREVQLVMRKTISDASMKLSSNYHEAIIQIRFEEKPKPEELQKKVSETMDLLAQEKKRDELSEAVDVKKVRGGYDLMVGSEKAAKHVSKRLAEKHKAELVYSNKLLGVDNDGKEKYRHTHCVRFKN